MKTSLVSIVIPTYNRREMVIRLLDSVLQSSYKNIEVIVVDDCSQDGTESAIQKHTSRNKKITVIRNSTSLFTAGSRNVGLKKAQGEYIFFIDDDNVIHPDAISLLVREFEKDETIGELGPVNYSYNRKKNILWARTRRNMLTSKTNQSRSLSEFGASLIWETDDVPNAFMIRTGVITKNNIAFRTQYEIMYEESDFAYRIRATGYTIKVVRAAKIYHDVETAHMGKKNKDYMYHFMENKRRPYVTARNRILFHSIYSTPIQLLSIMLIWIWVFAAYYSYKILSYSGYGNFPIIKRMYLILWYFKGIFAGIMFVLRGKKLS